MTIAALEVELVKDRTRELRMVPHFADMVPAGRLREHALDLRGQHGGPIWSEQLRAALDAGDLRGGRAARREERLAGIVFVGPDSHHPRTVANRVAGVSQL